MTVVSASCRITGRGGRRPTRWPRTARTEPSRPLPDGTYAQAAVLAAGDPAAERAISGTGAVISEDLATPKVLAVLQDAGKDQAPTGEGRAVAIAAADALLGLGLASLTPAGVVGGQDADGLTSAEREQIQQLIRSRDAARAARDWAHADQLRDQLGVTVTDTPDGPARQPGQPSGYG